MATAQNLDDGLLQADDGDPGVLGDHRDLRGDADLEQADDGDRDDDLLGDLRSDADLDGLEQADDLDEAGDGNSMTGR